MIQKAFDDIIKADIDFLINNKIAESKTIEYKEKLPGPKDSDKKEFLADVASFANSSGGDILYGIKAAVNGNGKKTGEPENVVPLQSITADEAKLRIESLIRTGIQPRIPIHIKEITGYGSDGNGFILLVRVSQSFASPHMVILKNWSRFYCRNSAGKYQLDVQEIRSAFLATDSQADRIRSFLQDRLAKIMADETPIELSMPHRLVLHILPLNSFFNQKRFDFGADDNLTLNFKPIATGSYNHRYNLDGFLTYQRTRETKLCNSYCQTYFDGTIEAVYADILRGEGGKKPKSSDTAFFSNIAYEKWVVEAIRDYFRGYKILGVEAPIIISMALLGCKGAFLYADLADEPMDRDIAMLPEVQTDSLDKDVPTIMKPIFDAVCNACGAPRSFNYAENGIWNVR